MNAPRYWTIGENIPGYLPMDDDATYIYEDFDQAKRDLIDTIDRAADSAAMGDADALADELIASHGTDQDHADLLADVVTNVWAYLVDVGRIDRPDSQGYAIAALMDDGGTLCEPCAYDETNPVHPAGDAWYVDGWGAWYADGWGIVGWFPLDGSDEDGLACDHCGRVLADDDQDDH